MVASRQVKRENASLPVAVRRSKTPVISTFLNWPQDTIHILILVKKYILVEYSRCEKGSGFLLGPVCIYLMALKYARLDALQLGISLMYFCQALL